MPPIPQKPFPRKKYVQLFFFLKFLSLNSNVFKNAHTQLYWTIKKYLFFKMYAVFSRKKIILYYLKYFVLICILSLFCFHSKKSKPSRSLSNPPYSHPQTKQRRNIFLTKYKWFEYCDAIINYKLKTKKKLYKRKKPILSYNFVFVIKKDKIIEKIYQKKILNSNQNKNVCYLF